MDGVVEDRPEPLAVRLGEPEGERLGELEKHPSHRDIGGEALGMLDASRPDVADGDGGPAGEVLAGEGEGDRVPFALTLGPGEVEVLVRHTRPPESGHTLKGASPEGFSRFHVTASVALAGALRRGMVMVPPDLH